VFAQNHDQIGNRMEGDRLSTLVSFEQLKLLAAFTLLSPYVPLLFMGEEYGETRPFPFFVSHGDPELVEAVRKGRKAEFAAFGWAGEPPDPQGEHTFESAILDPSVAAHGENRALLDLHRDLIALRTTLPLIREYDEITVDHNARRVLRVERTGNHGTVSMFANFAAAPQTVEAPPQATYVFSTADPKYTARREPGGANDARNARDAHNASDTLVLPPTSVLLLQVGAA
jgi:maltooligosyltrehalose trehalohydrolase